MHGGAIEVKEVTLLGLNNPEVLFPATNTTTILERGF
jgi:hypothetical protein